MRHDRLRPVDLAREHDLSAQAIRNYEDAGVLPQAPRGSQGYRRYTRIHAQALRTFLTLRPGYGHQVAADILRAANTGDLDTGFRLIDHGHAALRTDRDTLDEVAHALDKLTATEPAAPTGYRYYRPEVVRDAYLAQQLRRGGYLLRQIAPIITHLHQAGGITPLQDALRTWKARLHRRSRAMLDGSAELATYLHQLGQ